MNRQLTLLPLLIAITLLCTAQRCDGDRAKDGDKDMKFLYTTWFQSFEEDELSATVYRPVGYDFPVSRGREGFELKEDGTALLFLIAPADGIDKVKTTWTLEDSEFKIVIPDSYDAQRPDFHFKIMSMDSTRMTLRDMRKE